ncbi:hypothetical protein PIB30_019362, partial [Stylosanthes scabra]|nr:hypothetical protein [Stylosanthes scabra]
DSIAWSVIPRGNDTHFTVVLLERFGALADLHASKITDVFTTADCSIVSAAGIIEDVMVKVGRLVIPTDFHVIQPPPGEKGHPQVLLGRPFLKTSGFKLTYTDDIFTFSSGKITETFQISPPPKKKDRQDDGRMQGKEEVQIEMIEALIRELLQKIREAKGLEKEEKGKETTGRYQMEQKKEKDKSQGDCLRYRYREDVDKERKDQRFPELLVHLPSPTLLLILLLLLLPRDSRDNVADLMKSSPPTELILVIPGSTISRLRSILLQRDRQECEAAVLDRANEEVPMAPRKVYPPPSHFSRRLDALRARRAKDEAGPANAAPQEDEVIDVSSDSDSEQVPEYVPGEGATNEQEMRNSRNTYREKQRK